MARNKSQDKIIIELSQAVKLNNMAMIEQIFAQHAGKKLNLNALCDELTETLLTEAVKGGDLRTIEFLIEKGADVHAYNFSGKGPLHMAAYLGNNRVVSSLLAHKGNVDTPDKTGHGPLHWAARKHTHTVELLLQKDADVHKTTKDGSTSLHSAAEHGDEKLIKLLVDKDAQVDARNNEGETPAYSAAKGGNLAGLKLLVERGADVRVVTDENETLCHIAAEYGHLPIIEYLVDEHQIDKAFLNKVTSGGVCKIKGRPLPSGGWTALHFACAGGHKKVAEYLISQGVNMSVRSNEEMAPKDLVKIFKHTDSLMQLFQKKKTPQEWKKF